ncbi:DUF5988 family protein [Streptomyces sp. NPDC093225]|uniref:DUF5988 family protein n=1 Tax=Streptomyces sp. NPDC093225 TaxID=3366034 RepID=UPI00382F4B54
MSDSSKVVLEGGPADLPDRTVPAPEPGADLKLAHLGGYEHFRRTDRTHATPEGELPVYEWWERTELPG